MKKFIVYKHTNKSNRKVYIGITNQKPEKRWSGGCNYKGHFRHAIDKYGWDNFEHEILYENLEEMQAKLIEISLIRFYDSTNPEKGYNLSTGGEGYSGLKHSDETRNKISESLKGRKRKPFSDEHKKKMSESHYKQPIICIETGVEYESICDAVRKTGLPHGRIWGSCTKGWACKGFHFKKI